MTAGGSNIIATNGIVVEVLNRVNYSNWSKQVINYLKGEVLWHGVVEGVADDKAKLDDPQWEYKNCKALHAIQLACGKDTLSHIANITTAQEAWNQLKASYSEDVKAQSDEPKQTKTYDEHYDVQRKLLIKGFTNEVKRMTNRSHDKIFLRSHNGRTILHAVVARGLTDDVPELVHLGRKKLLNMQDNKGYTALALAAELTDNKEIAKHMVKNGGEELLTMKTKDKGEIPVLLAAANGHPEMTKYLFSVTPPSAYQHNNSLDLLLSRCITAEIFEVATAILEQPDASQLSLTVTDSTKYDEKLPTIYALAHMPSAFKSGTQPNWWQQFVYEILIIRNENLSLFNEEKIEIVSVEPEDGPNIMTNTLAGRFIVRVQQFLQTILLKFHGIQRIYDQKRKHQLVLNILKCFCSRVSRITSKSELSVDDAMLQAAKYGISEFIESMGLADPELLFVVDRNNRGIFSHAILNRQEKVFNILRKLGRQEKIVTSSVDVLKNNMLHLAAELGPSSYLASMSNAALQMQRELQWFKGVKSKVPHSFLEAKNANEEKPQELFTKTHEQLVKEAQQWAKDTSSAFTLIGTLIITVMFAVAFSVPGGVDDKEGTPVFLGKNVFNMFIIADAISLITSSSSVLMFIEILTSRNAEEDFLRIFPIKLLFGLVTLFLSVASMMVAFCGALALLLKGYRKIVIAAMWLALIPIMVFVPTLLGLLAQFFRSTMTPVIRH